MNILNLKYGIAALALTLASVGVEGTAEAAASKAANGTTFHSKSFNMSKTVFSPRAETCVTFTVWGKLTWRRTVNSVPRAGSFVSISDRKLESPTMSIKSWTGPGCRTKRANKPLTHAVLSEVWYEETCNTELSVAAGFPWNVGVGATLKCGNGVKRAALSDTFGRKSSTYRLNNSGRAPELPGAVRITPGRGKACTAVDASAKIRTDHNDSDNIGATFQVCAS